MSEGEKRARRESWEGGRADCEREREREGGEVYPAALMRQKFQLCASHTARTEETLRIHTGETAHFFFSSEARLVAFVHAEM